MPASKAVKRRVEAAAQRSAEKALREERLALAAIVKVFLKECPDLNRPLARVEAMVRAAEANPRTPAATRRMLLDGAQFIRTAVERELGKPQSLFDPHVGHTLPAQVDALVEAGAQPTQLGLGAEGGLFDVQSAHQERVTTSQRVQTVIVRLLTEQGPATDAELAARYLALGPDEPSPTAATLKQLRRELTASGRLRKSGDKGQEPVWDLVERTTTKGTT